MQSPTVGVALSNVSSLATPQGLCPSPQAPCLHSSSITPDASPASLQDNSSSDNHTPRMCVGIVEQARLRST